MRRQFEKIISRGKRSATITAVIHDQDPNNTEISSGCVTQVVPNNQESIVAAVQGLESSWYRIWDEQDANVESVLADLAFIEKVQP